MKKYGCTRKVIVGSTLGIALLLGAVMSAEARDPAREYLKWQAAKSQADTKYSEYMSTRSSSDYRAWQKAQGRLAKRYNKLVAAGGDVSGMQEGYTSSIPDTEMEHSSATAEELNVSTPDTENTENVSIETPNTPVYMNSERVENAKDAVRMGYIYGHRRGSKDGRHGHSYNAKVFMPYRGPYENPVIAGHKYKRFYEQGFLRGYDDGYNSTQKYGMVYKGRHKGYSVYSGVEESLVSTAG